MGSGKRPKLRRAAKTGLAAALHWTGADRAIGKMAGAGALPLVVGYHRVVEDIDAERRTALPGILMSLKTFERHLDWIGRRYDFITLDELGSRLEDGAAPSAAAITFDDGYSEFYHLAYPLLKRKGIPAAVFPVTGLVGTDQVPFYDRLYLLLVRAASRRGWGAGKLLGVLARLGLKGPALERLARLQGEPYPSMVALIGGLPQAGVLRLIAALEAEAGPAEGIPAGIRPFTWDMLREMRRGGVTIGSHSQTHALLGNESFQKALDETMGSRRDLEQRLGFPVEHFAYPCGSFNNQVLSAVAAADYRFAYTICRHREALYPRLTLPRIVLWENSCLGALERFSGSLMSCQINRVFDWTQSCRQNHGRIWPRPLSLEPAAAPAV